MYHAGEAAIRNREMRPWGGRARHNGYAGSGPSLRVPLTEILLSIDLNATPGANILEQAEREQILRALRKCNWVVGLEADIPCLQNAKTWDFPRLRVTDLRRA